MRKSLASWLCLVLLVGCGGDDDTGPPAADSAPGADGSHPDGGGSPPDAPQVGPDANGTSSRLIQSDYVIPPDTFDMYQCQRITATTDLYITRVTPLADQGTHHLVLAIDPSPQADGVQANCGPLALDWLPLFASGVDSPYLDMPPNVTLHVSPGQQIVLDLHLFNVSPSEIVGSSAIDVTTVPGPLMYEAEMVLAGIIPTTPPTPAIATGVQNRSGHCTMSGATNVFSVFPHMHQIGQHIKVTLDKGAGGQQVVYDADYDFNEQVFQSFTPVPMANGNQILVDCTYNNTTGGAVQFGQSSNQEMCFGISYRYPKLGTTFGGLCVN